MIRRLAAAAALVAASIAALSAPASAAAGPTFVGGQEVAPHAPSDPEDLSFNGTKSLAVWLQPKKPYRLVRGRLLAPDTTSQGAAFNISTGGKAYNPRAAWNGSTWLVVWNLQTRDIYGAVVGQRIASDGTRVGARITIASGFNSDVAVAAGHDGDFFVTWTDFIGSGPTEVVDVYGGRVSGSGAVLDGDGGLRLSTDTTASRTTDIFSDVAWNGSSYLVVWDAVASSTVTRLMGSQRGADGSLLHVAALSPVGVSVAGSVVASDSRDFLVASIGASGPNQDVYAARVDDDFDTTWLRIVRSPGTKHGPSIAFNGVWLVAWSEGSGEVAGTRVELDLTVDEPEGVELTSEENGLAAYNPAVAPGGSKAQTFGLLYGVGSENVPTGVEAIGVRWAASK